MTSWRHRPLFVVLRCLSATVWQLSGEAGLWAVETALPARRSHHSLAVLGGFVFAACDLLYRYDPRHNLWTPVSGPPPSSRVRRRPTG